MSLTEPEALAYLQETAGWVPKNKAIVELGVFRGGSLLRLAKGAALGAGAQVYGIDPWGLDGAYPTRPDMQRKYGYANMQLTMRALRHQRLLEQVTLLRGFGADEAKKWKGPKVALLYIDAVHTEEAVLRDYKAWQPHLMSRAVVAFDDYCERFAGVKRAVDNLFGESIKVIGTRLAVVQPS